MVLLGFSAEAANPSFQSFDQRYFSTSGNIVSLTTTTTNILYVDPAGNDSNSGSIVSPKLTLTAAKNAATNHYLIDVRPGLYKENNLFKNQVNWYFENGAVVIWTNGASSLVGIWDDRNTGAITSNIEGYGTFIYSIKDPIGSETGAFVITNANTYIDFEALCLTNSQINSINDGGSEATILIHNCYYCTLNVHQSITCADDSNYAIEWEHGNAYIHSPVITGNGVNTIFGAQDAAGVTSTSLYIDANLIDNEGTNNVNFSLSACVWWYGFSSNQRTWIHCTELHSLNNPAITFGYGRHYVEAQKVWSEATASPAIAEASLGDVGGSLFAGWGRILKVSAKYRFLEAASSDSINLSGKSDYHFDIQEFEELGSVTNGIILYGRTNFITGNLLVVTNGVGIVQSGGQTTFKGYLVSAKNPVLITTNGLIFNSCVLNASGSIAITNSGTLNNTVTLNSCFTMGTATNSPKVTISGNNIIGVTDGSELTAGVIGETVTNVLSLANATSLSTGTAKNVTNIVLTAGDWDVTGAVGFDVNAATVITSEAAGISLTSATLPALDIGQTIELPESLTGGVDTVVPLPVVRINVTTSTTVYLVAKASFSINTMTAYGKLLARRVR